MSVFVWLLVIYSIVATCFLWWWGSDPVWQIDQTRLSELTGEVLSLRDEAADAYSTIDAKNDQITQQASELKRSEAALGELRENHDRLSQAYANSRTMERRIRAILNGQPPEMGATETTSERCEAKTG